jgi:heptaprenyl diphosphate synthase
MEHRENDKKYRMSTSRLTRLALFAVLALAIYGIESALPPLTPIPGIKPGLANIITLIVIRNYSGRDASLVLIVRILLASLLFGQMVSMIYSLAGGFLCLIIMLFMNRLFSGHFIYITSICGAIAHNAAQMAVAIIITDTTALLAYMPFLLLSAVITGLFTGLCAHASQKYLSGFIS